MMTNCPTANALPVWISNVALPALIVRLVVLVADVPGALMADAALVAASCAYPFAPFSPPATTPGYTLNREDPRFVHSRVPGRNAHYRRRKTTTVRFDLGAAR